MNENKTNSISVSLLNRKIYSVCYPEVDTIAAFHGALFYARRRFYETGKTVHVREAGIYSGLSGETSGKISRRALKWKKLASGHTLEALFSQRKQHGIAFYEPGGILRCRMFLDNDHHWVRSEYYAPEDPVHAKTSFKPDPAKDAVLRFDYNHSTGKTKETVLLPVPYAFQSAEQSFQNAQFGENLFLVAMDTGEFAYCPKDEQKKRLEFLENSKDASVMLSMGWEIRDGDIIPTEQETDPALPQIAAENDKPDRLRELDHIFESIEETVRLKEIKETGDLLEELLEESRPAEQMISADSATPEEPAVSSENTAVPTEPAHDTESPLPVLGITQEELSYARDILNRLLSKPEEIPAEPVKPAEQSTTADSTSGITLIRSGEPMRYIGGAVDGKRDGFGRTESPEGFTVYEGEYKDDKRDGFGTHHYKSGAVSYIGDFKADQRDGFGVSFRENDHSLHVSHWANGKPEGYAALFDPSGTMRFAGKIIDGQKQGAGISIDTEKDTVFIAKYEDNKMTGEGALFSGDGTLLYMGGWENGKRSGHGTEFDRNGDIVYSGEWKDDRYENGILYKKVQGDPENGSD